jgi:hypothetical protein
VFTFSTHQPVSLSQNPNAAKEIIAESTARTKASIQRAKDEIISKMDDGGFFPRDLLL